MWQVLAVRLDLIHMGSKQKYVHTLYELNENETALEKLVVLIIANLLLLGIYSSAE